MSALESMIKIHSWVLDEKRQKLADVERFVDKMKLDLAKLDEHLAEERAAATAAPESALTFATFIRVALERRAKLLETIANLEQEAELARDEVRAAFQELKKFEKAETQAQSREESERKRREQLALDELGVGIYQRRANAGNGGES